MGNCLKSASTDDLTLLNGRATESNRESIDQEPNFNFQVRTKIFDFFFHFNKKTLRNFLRSPTFVLIHRRKKSHLFP